jgi:DHA1 family L-arabinose/isopropyl-beta-D-thiogalactopyranoside export protein-like MFS transporter/DHA1 family inner membrane transport protein
MSLDGTTRRAAGLFALSLATFVYVTTEVLPIGLLTVIAADLGRSRSDVGLLVTGYALVVVIASVPVTSLTRRVPRRFLLAGTLGVFVVGTLLTAGAVSYLMLLVARLLIGLSQALFWSVVGPTAAGLYPQQIRGRVLARLAIGTSLAPVLGVPVGTWIGQQAGWRVAFLVMAGVGLATCVAMLATVPATVPPNGDAARGPAPDALRYAILVVTAALGVSGFMTAYTYVTPFLLDVTGFGQRTLGPLLLVTGVAGVAGTLAVGAFLDRRPWAALAVPLVVLTGGLAALYAAGAVKPLAVTMLAATGLAFSALAAAVQNRTLQVAPISTELASAGTAAAFNVGIAAGSFVGGQLIAGAGVRSVALVGAGLAAAALAVLLSEAWLARVSQRLTQVYAP